MFWVMEDGNHINECQQPRLISISKVERFSAQCVFSIYASPRKGIVEQNPFCQTISSHLAIGFHLRTTLTFPAFELCYNSIDIDAINSFKLFFTLIFLICWDVVIGDSFGL